MLNKDGIRELAYVVAIDELRPIEGYDRVEHARVGGWWIIVRKDQFKVGDLAIYIEVDSKVPEREPFLFLDKRNFKVKTLKMCKVISQGLLMSPEDFGWGVWQMEGGDPEISAGHYAYKEGDFLTDILGITYAEVEDNKRKKNPSDKYKLMAQRHSKLFQRLPFRWLMRRKWGKQLLFIFFGKKKDKISEWPSWVIKTDEERCQNMPWLFPGNPNEEWVATEKVDGTSTTFTMKRGKHNKFEFYTCSRNVVFNKPEKECYYNTNVYLEMAEKYRIESVLKAILMEHEGLDFVTIQGETYGAGIQKRDYGMDSHDFKAFNAIFGFKEGVRRLNPIEMRNFLIPLGIPCVDIVDEHFIIPATCDELLAAAGGASTIDGGMREGLVFRSYDGAKSFKAVDNNFLLKYHG